MWLGDVLRRFCARYPAKQNEPWTTGTNQGSCLSIRLATSRREAQRESSARRGARVVRKRCGLQRFGYWLICQGLTASGRLDRPRHRPPSGNEAGRRPDRLTLPTRRRVRPHTTATDVSDSRPARLITRGWPMVWPGRPAQRASKSASSHLSPWRHSEQRNTAVLT